MSIGQESPFPQPPSAAPTAEKPGPAGIGGWLILPIIGFFGTIVLTGLNLLETIRSWDGIVAIFTTDSMSQARLPVALSLVGAALVIASAAFCLYLIFTKKRAVIPVATAHYLILAVAGLVDFWGLGVLAKAIPNMPADPTALRDAIRGVVIACIWIPYFHLSKRVRNTMVN